MISFSGTASMFRVFENYFDLPVMVICARLIDIIDEKVMDMTFPTIISSKQSLITIMLSVICWCKKL